MISEIQRSQIDAWAIYRMSIVGFIAIVLLVTLATRKNFRKTLREGILIPLVAYSGICLASTAWSIFPSWTAYRSVEFGTAMLLIALTVSEMRSMEDADQVLDYAFKLLALLIATIWIGLLFSPQQALKVSSGMIPFQLYGVLPFFETNIVGELGALLLVVSVARWVALGQHRSSRLANAMGMVVGSATLLLSQTRSAILAAFIAVALTLLIARPKFGSVVAGVGILAYLSGGANLIHEFMMRGEPEQVVEGLNGRMDFWTAGMDALSLHPLTGLGAYAGGRFGILPQFGFDAVTMHNTYMEVLVDTGLPGFLPILILLLAMWWILLRRRPGDSIRSSEQRLTVIAVFSLFTVRSFFDAEFIENSAVIFFALIAYTEYLRRTHLPTVSSEPAEEAPCRSSRAPVFSAIVFVCLVAVSAAPRLSAQTSGPITAQTFGMQSLASVLFSDTGQPWPTIPIGSVRLWDTGTTWAELNPSAGIYDFSYIDLWISAAQSHGVSDILYTFGRVPQWASSLPNQASCGAASGNNAPPSDLNRDGSGADQLWQNFVAALVTHAAGRIKYWELWNEPSYCGFWTGSNDQMIRMAKDAYRIIHSIDPNAVVLSPAPEGPISYPPSLWMGPYLAAGGGNYADVISFHGPDPLSGPAVAEDIVVIVQNLRKVMASYGAASKQLWDTEGNWGSSTNLSDPQEQAAFLARYYILHCSLGVQRLYWYGWNNQSFGTLWDSSHHLHPAALAYEQVFKWVVGSKITRPCVLGRDATWICEMNAGSRIMWSASTVHRTTAPYRFQSVEDLQGNVQSNPSMLEVGPSPIMVRQMSGNFQVTEHD